MLRTIMLLNQLTRLSGHLVRWLALLMVAGTLLVVALRYITGIPILADIPAVMLQEAVLYAHAALFMLGAAYTWQQGGHVRVDVFYRNWSPARRRLADRLGIVLLVMPFCVFLFWVSWRYVANSWAILERSPESGGLPLVFALKSMLLALPVLLLIQAVAELGKTFAPDAENGSVADKETHYG